MARKLSAPSPRAKPVKQGDEPVCKASKRLAEAITEGRALFAARTAPRWAAEYDRAVDELIFGKKP